MGPELLLYYLLSPLLVPTVFCLLQVEKQRVNKTIKSQQFEDAKNEYASQLQKTNEAQAKYYNHFKPQVLTNFQDLDERRIKCIQVNRVVGCAPWLRSPRPKKGLDTTEITENSKN